ncbi:hypothetical protein LNI96_03240 [Tenacibaculum dicentrarchi]|nr:hypothetical protein [Tenacibaculum dicentrarchi]
MAKQNKEQHAQRNKALSIQLLKEGTYLDWVVTTSFYSSIHFIENNLLPTTIKGKTCSELFDVKKVYKTDNLHQTREFLCQEKLTFDTAIKYKWLSDNSKNARYTSYKISKSVAEKALKNLELIEKECKERA